MKRKAIFTSESLKEEISKKANDKNQNLFIEDMVNGSYYRCFGVVYDNDGNLIIRIKSLKDLHDGNNDLYMK